MLSTFFTIFVRKNSLSETKAFTKLMKKSILALLCAGLCAGNLRAQRFEDYFEDCTLRLDYVFAGNSRSQHIYFEKALTTSRWAGRRARLAEMPLRGNGQLYVKDHRTGRLIYTHTFSTLFQEWQATEEATKVDKAFETSYQVPLPLRPVDITITLTDTHNKVVGEMTHTLDPHDILIRRAVPNGIPSRYVWKADSVPDIARCIDLAIVAEGYTAGEMDKFQTDCRRVVDALFAREPFYSLKTRFNVVAVAPPSLTTGPSEPGKGHWSNTPLGSHYDTFYSERYLTTASIHRLYDVLSDVPFEHIIVLVNTPRYGGGGIYNQVMVTPSDHATFAEVLVHEFGHSYAGLGDEYFYDDAYENIYPADTEPWEPNLTTLADFSSKWADLLPQGTPIPTPPAKIPDYRNIRSERERRQLNAATHRVGVFEGGGYQSKGVYRPAQECRMKINEVEDFCPVCSRAIKRITDFYTATDASDR